VSQVVEHLPRSLSSNPSTSKRRKSRERKKELRLKGTSETEKERTSEPLESIKMVNSCVIWMWAGKFNVPKVPHQMNRMNLQNQEI
jgi:hypothetical protein